LTTWIDGFLLDRKASGLAKGSLEFYAEKLQMFVRFCEGRLITRISQVTPNDIREYLLKLSDEGHTPGGTHAAFRSLRAFLRWWENEVEPEGWKNPISKVKAPKVGVEPLDPVDLDIVGKMLETCQKDSFVGDRDRAILMALLDTGVRADELIKMDKGDLNVVTGAILVRKGKGHKPRMVYLGEKGSQSNPDVFEMEK